MHDFAIAGVKSGALLAPGTSETRTIGLPAKAYVIVCDLPFHVERGMTAEFDVTQ